MADKRKLDLKKITTIRDIPKQSLPFLSLVDEPIFEDKDYSENTHLRENEERMKKVFSTIGGYDLIESNKSLKEDEQIKGELKNEDLQESLINATTCNRCNLVFETVEEQRIHFRSNLHRTNVLRLTEGKSALTEEEFKQHNEESGSDFSQNVSSDEEDNDDNDDDDIDFNEIKEDGMSSVNKLNPKELEEYKDYIIKKQFKGSPFVSFVDNDKEIVYTMYKALFEDTTKPSAVQLQKIYFKYTSCFIVMAGGGHFAAGIFDFKTSRLLKHKTFHRYTVRKGQGGSQSTKDSQGKNIKSAGSWLRRQGEIKLAEEVLELLESWKDDISKCNLLFIRASGPNTRKLVIKSVTDINNANKKDYRLLPDDKRIRHIPFSTKRATTNEVKRSFFELISIKSTMLEEYKSKKDDLLTIKDTGDKNDSNKKKSKKRNKKNKKKSNDSNKSTPNVSDNESNIPENVKLLHNLIDKKAFKTIYRLVNNIPTIKIKDEPSKDLDLVFKRFLGDINISESHEDNNNEQNIISLKDINFIHPTESSALHHALRNGQSRISLLLLLKGADLLQDYVISKKRYVKTESTGIIEETIDNIKEIKSHELIKDKETRDFYRMFIYEYFIDTHLINGFEGLSLEKYDEKIQKQLFEKELELQKQRQNELDELERINKEEQERKQQRHEKEMARRFKGSGNLLSTVNNSSTLPNTMPKEIQQRLERERRARAAEQRLLGKKPVSSSLSSSTDSWTCGACGKSLVGIRWYERNNVKFCSTSCLQYYSKVNG